MIFITETAFGGLPCPPRRGAHSAAGIYQAAQLAITRTHSLTAFGGKSSVPSPFSPYHKNVVGLRNPLGFRSPLFLWGGGARGQIRFITCSVPLFMISLLSYVLSFIAFIPCLRINPNDQSVDAQQGHTQNYK
jgi:hypothetical protein